MGAQAAGEKGAKTKLQEELEKERVGMCRS